MASVVPTAPPPGTLAAWLQEAAGRLARAGVPCPRRDAQRLAAHALGLRWGELWSRLRDQLTPPQREALDALAARRERREPLAYLLGSVEFCGLQLAVGPGVLVPRPETETVVEVALRLLGGVRFPVVADVGTGSGAIAAALAAARPDATLWATELSPAAAAYARRNAAPYGVRVLEADLLDGVPAPVDLVVSNPPYVPAGGRDLVEPEVLAEPPEAVFAGPAGDEVLRRLAAEAPRWLAADGRLVLEVGTPAQARELSEALAGWRRRGVEPDAAGRARVVWAVGPP